MRVASPDEKRYPCAKQVVKATIVTSDGRRFTGTNFILNEQATCPRGTLPSGEGYHLCREVCAQPGHAEVNALAAAGDAAWGSVLYLEGHTRVCDDCMEKCYRAGVMWIHLCPPPQDITQDR